MQQVFHEIQINTKGQGLYDFTEKTISWLNNQKIKNGMLNINILHTSASLVIQENADPGVRRDLERFMARICPDGDPVFEPDYEGPDDMPAHVRTALTAVNLSIPIFKGRMTLGTWQGIFLWEHRHAGHQRKITIHLLGQ